MSYLWTLGAVNTGFRYSAVTPSFSDTAASHKCHSDSRRKRWNRPPGSERFIPLYARCRDRQHGGNTPYPARLHETGCGQNDPGRSDKNLIGDPLRAAIRHINRKLFQTRGRKAAKSLRRKPKLAVMPKQFKAVTATGCPNAILSVARHAVTPGCGWRRCLRIASEISSLSNSERNVTRDGGFSPLSHSVMVNLSLCCFTNGATGKCRIQHLVSPLLKMGPPCHRDLKDNSSSRVY